MGLAVRLLPAIAAAALLASSASASVADKVECYYTYGGETKTLTAFPVSSPYNVGDIAVGSYFRFRLVFQDQPAESAAIKVYTYADRDEGPVLIHQASFPYPPAKGAASRYGFSGLHFVYEPVRDGELQYWCRMESGAG
jgi:hypothetical protein